MMAPDRPVVVPNAVHLFNVKSGHRNKGKNYM